MLRSKFLATALAVLAVPLWLSAAHAQRGPARVIVDAVAEVDVAETQTLIARLVAVNQSVVATRIPGIVGTVQVDVGSRVEKGDVLVALDTELLAIELQGARATFEQAVAGVSAAQANLEAARNAYTRTDGLRGSAAFSQGRMDDLTSERARAEAELARAQAAIAVTRSGLQTAEYRERNAKIRAPFDGVVVSRSANLGAYLDTGAPVVTLIDDGKLEIEADVPTEIVAALDPGEDVTAIMDDGTIALANVRATVPNENPSTRTRPVRFTLNRPESAKPLAANQTVRLEAPVGDQRSALSVSKDALVQQGGGWIVYVARDGKATPVRVDIGAAVADRFEVRGDVQPGDLVIVRGNERLRPGQAVAFEPPAAAEIADEGTNTVAAGSAEAPAGASQ